MKVQRHRQHHTVCSRHPAFSARRTASQQALSGIAAPTVALEACPATGNLSQRRDWPWAGARLSNPCPRWGPAAYSAGGWHSDAFRQLRSGTWMRRAQGGGTRASSSSSIAVSQYVGRGSFAVSSPVQLRFRVDQGSSNALDCSLNVFLPQGSPHPGSQGWPLLVMSAGFLLHSGMYGSYATDLASWGLAVVLYDLPELVDDVTMVSALRSVLDACTSDTRVSRYIDGRSILLGGHSRGGKLSVLTAASDSRVKAIALLDPVDVTSMMPMGPGYPSSLPAMQAACSPPRSIPALIVGAACNTGVIPAEANYRRFLASCPSPCWFLELTGAGHLQFLDAKVALLSAFVESGPTSDEAVRRISKAAILAWALNLAVPLARGEPLDGPQVLERLQQTAAVLQRQAPLSFCFKGFDILGGAASSSVVSATGSTAAAATATGASSASSSSRSAASARRGSDTQQSWSWSRTGQAQRPGPSPSRLATGGAGAASMPGGSTGGASRNGVQGRGWNYEELIRMRARELKAILVDRGVECSDCFEKADLVKRIIERC